MDEQANLLPLYEQVRRSILAGIETGQFVEGSFLPLEPELMARYGVSRITLRRAISELCADGRLPSFDDEQLHFDDPDRKATIARYQALGIDRVIIKNGGKGTVMSGRPGCSVRAATTWTLRISRSGRRTTAIISASSSRGTMPWKCPTICFVVCRRS
ncbi:hypothetical protein A9Z06_33610 [Rhizobium sp. YK2]|nr:hypothetical protein A9Z06_33610 [Rhizobium sp. YK2]